MNVLVAVLALLLHAPNPCRARASLRKPFLQRFGRGVLAIGGVTTTGGLSTGAGGGRPEIGIDPRRDAPGCQGEAIGRLPGLPCGPRTAPGRGFIDRAEFDLVLVAGLAPRSAEPHRRSRRLPRSVHWTRSLFTLHAQTMMSRQRSRGWRAAPCPCDPAATSGSASIPAVSRAAAKTTSPDRLATSGPCGRSTGSPGPGLRRPNSTSYSPAGSP